MRGQALSLTYGRFFAEFLEDLSLVRLGLLDLTTCVGLRYGRRTLSLEVFLGTALSTLRSPVGERCGYARNSAWRIYLPHFLAQPTQIQLWAVDTAVRRSIAYANGHGILTVCPSGSALAYPLGPTNPELIIMALETLVFRRAGFSPALWLLVPASSLPYAPRRVTPYASAHTERSPTAYLSRRKGTPADSALRLTPIIFGAGTLDE